VDKPIHSDAEEVFPGKYNVNPLSMKPGDKIKGHWSDCDLCYDYHESKHLCLQCRNDEADPHRGDLPPNAPRGDLGQGLG